MNTFVLVCVGFVCNPVDEIKTSFVVLLSLTCPIAICLFFVFCFGTYSIIKATDSLPETLTAPVT